MQLKANRYRVVNRARNTNWKQGIIIERLDHWDSKGFALFCTVSERGGAGSAHMSEVKQL